MPRGDGRQIFMDGAEQVLGEWSRWPLGQVRMERWVESGSQEALSSIWGISNRSHQRGFSRVLLTTSVLPN